MGESTKNGPEMASPGVLQTRDDSSPIAKKEMTLRDRIADNPLKRALLQTQVEVCP